MASNKSMRHRVTSRTTPLSKALRFEQLEDRRVLAVLTVNTLDGSSSRDAELSFEEAIELVNGAGTLSRTLTAEEAGQLDVTEPFGTNDTIEFDESVFATRKFISLRNRLRISSDMTIAGPGHDQLELYTGQSWMFLVDDLDENNQIDVAIHGLTLRGISSRSTNALIYNYENLSFTSSSIGPSNFLRDEVDVGIENYGTATIEDSVISGLSGWGIDNQNSSDASITINSSTISNNGYGGILNGGTAFINNTDVIDNDSQAINIFVGAGIENFGTATVTDSSVRGNTGPGIHNFNTESFNAGSFSAGSITVNGTTISNNAIGLSNEDNGTATVNGSTIRENTPLGIFNNGGTITVEDSLIRENTHADSIGSIGLGSGGVYNRLGTATIIGSTISDNVGFDGGGIASEGGSLTVIDSTIRENEALEGGFTYWGGGGIATSGDTTITGSTISGNTTGEMGGGVFVGLLHDDDDTVTISNSTISGNHSQGGAGGIDFWWPDTVATIRSSTIVGNTSFRNFSSTGRGGINASRHLTIDNSIVANNEHADVLVSLGTLQGSHNLIADGSGRLSDTITGDPMLGPLAFNGGPTHTHELLPGSPAIDQGDLFNATQMHDQRGAPFARDDGNGVDIGAFEAQTTTLSPLDCDYVAPYGCDIADIDALYFGLGSAPSPLTDARITQWLSDASDLANPSKSSIFDVYVRGDVDLSGSVDSFDLGLLLNRFGGEVFGLGWGQGNLNSDAIVDSIDLGLLLNRFGHNSVAATSASTTDPYGLNFDPDEEESDDASDAQSVMDLLYEAFGA